MGDLGSARDANPPPGRSTQVAAICASVKSTALVTSNGFSAIMLFNRSLDVSEMQLPKKDRFRQTRVLAASCRVHCGGTRGAAARSQNLAAILAKVRSHTR